MQRIELEHGGVCELHAQWLSAPRACELFVRLRDEVPWQRRAIRVFGREVLQPRLVAWIGDPEAVYTYSRTRHEPLPWTPALAELRARVAAEVGVALNSVLCNLYRDGQDSMGMHSDSEPELGDNPVIASLSLGAARRFCLRPRRGRQGSLDLVLEAGSLLVMRGTTQHHYRHGTPKQPQVRDARINLTFRRVVPP